MQHFVRPESIVKSIWGDADVILLIFAGSAGEFALNRAVDWLFFTGKLPADPIGRLFSTVQYAQEIVFSDKEGAERAIRRIHAIHGGVEKNRGQRIPDWAYRDVLYMLIDYSERAYQLLHRPLTPAEKEEIFQVFRQVGEGLQIPDLPPTYADWLTDRRNHIRRDLAYSIYTKRLFERYREELGAWRFGLLIQAQSLLVPERVHRLLDLPPKPLLASTMWLYKGLNRLGLRSVVQRALLPTEYLKDIRNLDRAEVM
ncbi:hypothetical protein GCM10023187_46920 [Nibrella viscosa]|uniref:ER-bound oxygenase mpaB/mpaB'/Rubber oxygenase catalytic domain-containing protein n=1 Tax=Nibrella viscosa TaxID=1084524 RepID=A0ABP8KV55_9BACT